MWSCKSSSTGVGFRLLSVILAANSIVALGSVAFAHAQVASDSPYFARKNTLGVFSAYSANSSHILLGSAERRKLFDVGISYNRRLFLNRVVNWQYSGEILPVALESNPLLRYVNNQTSPTVATFTGILPFSPVTCTPVVTQYSTTYEGVTHAGTQTDTCYGREWTVGEAMSPIGMQWNFLPRRNTQPFIDGHGGYMYSTQEIPVQSAGSFNFTFDLGAGFEIYRTKTQSIRAEYRYHHISNHNTANENPGIDNGLFQVTYTFGFRRR